jgi:hypothetical protein
MASLRQPGGRRDRASRVAAGHRPDIEIPMHVQYVALCEQVIIAADGKPSLISVFNDLQAPQFPITIPRLVFVARIHFTSDETGKPKKVEVIITDPNGVELARPSGDVTLPPVPSGLETISVDLPLQLDMFQLDTTGRYTFLLHIDGKAAAAVQLSVRQAALA